MAGTERQRLSAQPSLWRCPKCRRWLPQRKAVHVCAPAVPLGEHFRGKSPVVRKLFEAVRTALKRIGPVRMDSTKTRIAFRVWTIFVELTPQKNALRGCLMLPQPARHPVIFGVISLSPRVHYHFFKLTDPKQLDAGFRRLLREAYTVGRREHLKRRASTRQPLGVMGPLAAPARKVSYDTSRPLWRCPKCGNYFVSRNHAHSCVRVPLARHFRGKDPLVRKTFDALVAALRRHGPLIVVSSKTRITFMVRMRFAGVTPHKHSLPGGFALTRRVRHPLLTPGPGYGRIYGYHFNLTHPKQIDASFQRLLAKAYKVGRQEHLARA